LKVIRRPGDEWRSGETLDHFDGRGVVRAYEYIDGAVMMEHLIPGESLVKTALSGKDDEATEILADVIARMSPRRPIHGMPTIQDWSMAFDSYGRSGDTQIPAKLVSHGGQVYNELCATQSQPRLLHGDLHHYNVLSDSKRGWLAIDPKGVVGEVAYEIGAALRNPVERPSVFAERSVIQKRLQRFGRALNLDVQRMLAWGFAQAVLSAIWTVEDEGTIEPTNPSLALAETIRPMLGSLG